MFVGQAYDSWPGFDSSVPDVVFVTPSRSTSIPQPGYYLRAPAELALERAPGEGLDAERTPTVPRPGSSSTSAIATSPSFERIPRMSGG